MTRGDELPRHIIPESEWPRFLQATVVEWILPLSRSCLRWDKTYASICPKESFFRDMFIVRNLERVSGQRQKPSVGGLFLVIVIQMYDSFSITPNILNLHFLVCCSSPPA